MRRHGRQDGRRADTHDRPGGTLHRHGARAAEHELLRGQPSWTPSPPGLGAPSSLSLDLRRRRHRGRLPAPRSPPDPGRGPGGATTYGSPSGTCSARRTRAASTLTYTSDGARTSPPATAGASAHQHGADAWFSTDGAPASTVLGAVRPAGIARHRDRDRRGALADASPRSSATPRPTRASRSATRSRVRQRDRRDGERRVRHRRRPTSCRRRRRRHDRLRRRPHRCRPGDAAAARSPGRRPTCPGPLAPGAAYTLGYDRPPRAVVDHRPRRPSSTPRGRAYAGPSVAPAAIYIGPRATADVTPQFPRLVTTKSATEAHPPTSGRVRVDRDGHELRRRPSLRVSTTDDAPGALELRSRQRPCRLAGAPRRRRARPFDRRRGGSGCSGPTWPTCSGRGADHHLPGAAPARGS